MQVTVQHIIWETTQLGKKWTYLTSLKIVQYQTNWFFYIETLDQKFAKRLYKYAPKVKEVVDHTDNGRNNSEFNPGTRDERYWRCT